MRKTHLFLCFLCSLSSMTSLVKAKENTPRAEVYKIENEYLRYEFASDGTNLRFVDPRTDTNYCSQETGLKMSRILKGGVEHEASRVSYQNGMLTSHFGNTGITAEVKVRVEPHYIVLKVVSISDESVDKLTLMDIPLTSQGTLEDRFSSCALSLNIQTHVLELPGPNNRIRASCYKRFGIIGAQAAILGCPQEQMRDVMQQVVSEADGLPKSDLGGPWALDADRMLTRGSYVFNFNGIPEDQVDAWIDYTRKMGANQIDFHGSKSFRFGDCMPNPEIYPNGFADLKKMIARLHKANIKAGLHTYSFFIDKKCPWVTPVPDPQLAFDETFTLTRDLAEDSNSVYVAESTAELPVPKTGYFVRNSITLRIEDELITYDGIQKEPPYAFIGVQRGACGTRVSSHPKGTKAYHLKECFGYFVPIPGSALWDQVVTKTADAYNVCDFDMIYLDAIDAADIFTGKEDNWYYEAKFVFDLIKRLKKPPLMEMSSFSHLLWCARSRVGAWDVSKLSHKTFIDIHHAQNEKYKTLFLPSNLGWWTLRYSDGVQIETTFPDDLEYLLCKSLASDSGLSFIEGSPEELQSNPYRQKMAEKIRQYEFLRHEQYFPPSVREKLNIPGEEFKLEKNELGQWQFRPMRYEKHKVKGLDGETNVWYTHNTFETQPLQVRLEALYSAKPYDCPEALVLVDFKETETLEGPYAAPGIRAQMEPSEETVKGSSISGCYTAANTSQRPQKSWVEFKKTFPSLMDLSKYKALGVWIYGDGKGQVLNFQIKTPEYLVPCIGERYVIIDFVGWRYLELIELDGERFEKYSWPYADIVYDIYRQSYAVYAWILNDTGVESLGLWFNDIPAEQSVKCYLSSVKALPLVKIKIIRPSIEMDGSKITFDTEIETGQYLEFHSADDCKLYDSKGRFVRDVTIQGNVPILKRGENQVRFDCNEIPEVNARARITIISQSSTALTRD